MATEEGENQFDYLGLCLVFNGLCALLAVSYICKSCGCGRWRCGGDRTVRTLVYDEGERGGEKTCAEEIDSMRAATILRCLHGFTLVSDFFVACSYYYYIMMQYSLSNAQAICK